MTDTRKAKAETESVTIAEEMYAELESVNRAVFWGLVLACVGAVVLGILVLLLHVRVCGV
jgi:hypothetical protein